MPQLTNPKCDILVLNAHPDDSDMAMGGSLLLFADAGFRIVNLCLTSGQSGTFGSATERTKEFFAAQEFLGARGLMWEYEDTRLECSRDIVERVAGLIREVKPKMVFAPNLRNDRASFDGMANRDHSVTGHIAAEAVKLARLKNAIPEGMPHTIEKLFFYMIPSGQFPQFVVDVSTVMDRWKKLLSCYSSQLNIEGIEDTLVALRLAHGREARVSYAEAFVTEMPFLIKPGTFL